MTMMHVKGMHRIDTAAEMEIGPYSRVYGHFLDDQTVTSRLEKSYNPARGTLSSFAAWDTPYSPEKSLTGHNSSERGSPATATVGMHERSKSTGRAGMGRLAHASSYRSSHKSHIESKNASSLNKSADLTSRRYYEGKI